MIRRSCSSHGDDFITNSKGEINYNNIPGGVYNVKMVPLTEMGEWFDGKEQEVLVNGKQTIYLSLSRGVKLTGGIFIARDKYSGESGKVDFSRIRITAVDSAGKSFSALTNQEGSFSMYLPYFFNCLLELRMIRFYQIVALVRYCI